MHKVFAVGAAALLVLLESSGCGHQADRMVDCAPGYHNQSGPASDCVPDSSAPQ